jgi:hypothetical protein
LAPVGGRGSRRLLAQGAPPPGTATATGCHLEWPDDLAKIVCIDPFGKPMIGLRAVALPEGAERDANANGLAGVTAHPSG